MNTMKRTHLLAVLLLTACNTPASTQPTLLSPAAVREVYGNAAIVYVDGKPVVHLENGSRFAWFTDGRYYGKLHCTREPMDSKTHEFAFCVAIDHAHP